MDLNIYLEVVLAIVGDSVELTALGDEVGETDGLKLVGVADG